MELDAWVGICSYRYNQEEENIGLFTYYTSHRGEQAMAVAKHASAMISPNSVMSRDAVHA